MSGKGPAEPFRKLLPQSWLGWFAAAVIVVVGVTHPAESWHATSKTVWGAGRWAGYEAFAGCGTPPPYGWMSEKRCQVAVTVSDQSPEQGPVVTVSAAPAGGRDDQASVDRVITEATHLHRVVDAALTADGAKCTQQKACGS